MGEEKYDAEAAETSPGNERENIAFRLSFLDLSPEDAQRLKQAAPLFESHLDEFVEVFYRHLFSFPQTAQFLADPKLVARLKQVQRAHLQSMLEADWNEEYAESRHRVGRVHAREGIAPEWFLGSYNLYLQYWLRQNESQCDASSREHFSTIQSLIRVVMLDIGLTLDAYFQESTAQLRKALEMYWQVNTELRQFAQLASHDLKTPLATVANLCDEALDEFSEKMPTGAVELIEKAKQRVYRMSSTIDELLAGALQADDSEIDQQIDTRHLAEEVVEEIKPLLDRQNIQLTIVGEFPAVMGSRVRLREILANLLSNALKYMDKSPGRIDVLGKISEEHWILSVRDNGPGIPAEDCTKIFSPFLRLRVHQHVPGSGLGLYFAKNMVHQMHGRIWVESQPGEESCFHVALPRSIITENK